MNVSTETILSLQAYEFSLNASPSLGLTHGKLAAKVDELRSRLPGQILHAYDTRKRRFGAGSVVPIENGVCTGCCVMLSQRTLRLSYSQLIECEHCGRLVYSANRRRRVQFEVCAA